MKKADINSGELIVRIQDKISSMGKNSSWAQLMEAILSEIVILQEEYASQPKDKDQPSETTTLTQNNGEITINGIKYVPEHSRPSSRVMPSEDIEILYELHKHLDICGHNINSNLKEKLREIINRGNSAPPSKT